MPFSHTLTVRFEMLNVKCEDFKDTYYITHSTLKLSRYTRDLP